MLVAMRAASQLRIFATILVLAAWLVVLRGLYFLPRSTRIEHDLDAGQSFGVNFAVYFPALGITVLLIGLLAAGIWARHVGSLAAAMAALLTLAFGFWVLTVNELLLDIRPGLDLHLWFDIGLSSIAILIALLAGLTYREASKAVAT